MLEGSGTVINVPTISQLDIVETVGSTSGLEISKEKNVDKFKAYGLETFAGQIVEALLLEGCAAWADERVISVGHWHFQGHDELRTLHHVARGHFLVIGMGWQGAGAGWARKLAGNIVQRNACLLSFLTVDAGLWEVDIFLTGHRPGVRGNT